MAKKKEQPKAQSVVFECLLCGLRFIDKDDSKHTICRACKHKNTIAINGTFYITK